MTWVQRNAVLRQRLSMILGLMAGLLLAMPLPALAKYAAIIVDAETGKVLHEANSDTLNHPASLTKMMTLYVISNALRNEQIHLADNVRISQEAWKIGGSRMFVKEGQQVSVEELLKGIQ